MSLQLWLAFVAASAVLLVIPGPTILTVISYSVAHGRKAKVPLVAAVALGDSTALVLSLLGLGSLLATPSTVAVPDSRGRLFVNTYAVTALNPKGIVFFIAFLPQFLAPGAPVAPQLWLLAITFVVLATLNATLYAVFAGAARRMLESRRAQRGFNLVGGSLLGGAGLWALVARRAA